MNGWDFDPKKNPVTAFAKFSDGQLRAWARDPKSRKGLQKTGVIFRDAVTRGEPLIVCMKSELARIERILGDTERERAL